MPTHTTPADYDEVLLRGMYRRMKLIREVEETFSELAEAGETPGDAHLYIGQEAIAVGTCLAIRDDDVIVGTHRGHGHVLAKGVDVNEVMAEFGGKETGLSNGRGGEMALFAPNDGVLETTGMVGANPPHIVGAMLAATLDGTDQVGVSFFGEGATNQGVAHEAMNLAAVWDLPVIFVCENNKYGVSTPADTVVAGDLCDRVEGYGIPAEKLDGQDVFEVYEAVLTAAEEVRNGDGPRFFECDTYRYSGHFSAEAELLGDRPYRPEAEVERWKAERDPITTFKSAVESAGALASDDLMVIDDEVTQTVAEAVEFMQESDFPDEENALTNVYTDEEYPTLPIPSYR